jgi:hypothetical protein
MRSTRRAGRSAGLAVGIALLGGATTVGFAGCAADSGPPSASSSDAGSVPSAAARTVGPTSTSRPPAAERADDINAPDPVVLAPPSGLTVPKIATSATVVPVQVDTRTGALEVPADVREVGWWEAGPRPGSQFGTVVLTGHIDSADQGPGMLARLREVGPGDRVVVRAGGRDVRYVVKARREYRKAALPVDVFSPVGDPRLVIVSCGGPFDAASGHYRDNVVVFATPV